jgi:diguanylate cyclase (GGDEF)-like protein
MLRFLRMHVAARSSAMIVLAVATIGAAFLAVALAVAVREETARQHERVGQLVDTVARTTGIASYLGDAELADEVAQGLLVNRIVSGVTVRSGSRTLARRTRAESVGEAASALRRDVLSPFDSQLVVGTIEVETGRAEVTAEVQRATADLKWMLLLQVIVSGAAAIWVVLRLVTRPIVLISERLHRLSAEAGDRLEVPRGNETNEIGQLVRDVNAMADRLGAIVARERELRMERERAEREFRAIFEHADTGIFLLDAAGAVTSSNPAYARLFDPSKPFPDAALVAECVAGRKAVARDIALQPGRADTRWANVVLTPMSDSNVQGVANDITERKRSEQATGALAVTDRLTGLGNRLAFETRLAELCTERRGQHAGRFTLMMADLDGFKQVNDTYGHKAGDDVLVEIAARLLRSVRSSDFVGRFGGDEFVLLLPGTTQPEAIGHLADKVIDAVRWPIAAGAGRSATVGMSIGSVVYSPGATHDELVRRADEAMYAAKQSGRNCHRLDAGKASAAAG